MQVRAQHHFKGKRRAAVAPFGVVRRNQLNQRCPRHNLIHLFKQDLLARLHHHETQVKAALFHGSRSCPQRRVLTRSAKGFCRMSLRADLQDVNFDRLDDQSPMDNAVSIGFPIRR